MEILHRDSLKLGGFAGLREHRLVTDKRIFGRRAEPGTWDGIGNFVYLADARFLPSGETRLHQHREIDVISVMVEGRIAHEGSLEHGQQIETNDVQAQRAGGGVMTRSLQKLEPAASQDQVNDLVDGLERARIVTRSEDGAWILTRDPQELTLFDLYRSGTFSLLPASTGLEGDGWDVRLAEVLDPLGDEVETGLSCSVRELYLDPNEPGTSLEKESAREQAVPATAASNDTVAEEAQNVG